MDEFAKKKNDQVISYCKTGRDSEYKKKRPGSYADSRNKRDE